MKSERCRLGTYRPLRSNTETGTVTRSVSILITSSPLATGNSVFPSRVFRSRFFSESSPETVRDRGFRLGVDSEYSGTVSTAAGGGGGTGRSTFLPDWAETRGIIPATEMQAAANFFAVIF